MVLMHGYLALIKYVLTQVTSCILYICFMKMFPLKIKELKHEVEKCQTSGRNDDILKRQKQITGQWTPKKWKFPQESHAERRKRQQPEGELVSEKETSYSSRERLKPRQGWVNSGLDHTLTRTAWMCKSMTPYLNSDFFKTIHTHT